MAPAGAYVVVLRVAGEGVDLRVGALGRLTFRPGCYCYVGSALGGLASRMGRHLKKNKKRSHWHIDHLAACAAPVAAFAWPTAERLECQLSEKLARAAQDCVEGFGASDCGCSSHLYFFRRDPSKQLGTLRLRDRQGGQIEPRRVRIDAHSPPQERRGVRCSHD